MLRDGLVNRYKSSIQDPRVKILITNIVTLNAGDAAILYAMVKILRATFGEDTRFIVYDKHGELPNRYYPEFEFRRLLYLTREPGASSNLLARLRFKLGLRAIKHGIPLLTGILLTDSERRDLLEYKTADLIVSSGGTYLVENYSLDARIFDYRIAHYFEKPLVFFTQSLGPFRNEANRRALLPIFEKSIAILLRDPGSQKNLFELGVKNRNAYVAADAAFALSDVAALQSINAKGHTGRLLVAISVREWQHFISSQPAEGMNQYRQALQALSKHLVEKHNAQITFLSTCQGMSEYWTDDSKVAQTIVDGLDEETRASVSVDSDFHDPSVLARKLKDYDLVIATRMHMAILALGVGTPVLPIAYEFKMHELFEQLGQKRWVQDIENISSETLTNAFDEFLQALPQIRETIFSAVKEQHDNAVASGQLVKHAFEKWRQSKT